MKIIYKYRLKGQKEQVLELPLEAEILTVQEQKGEAMLWALVNAKFRPKTVKIMVIPTGSEFNDEGFEYLNTFQMENGNLVFHVFKQK